MNRKITRWELLHFAPILFAVLLAAVAAAQNAPGAAVKPGAWPQASGRERDTDAAPVNARPKNRALAPSYAAIDDGRQKYLRYGCAVCHGADLRGGLANPNAQGGEVPSLLHVADDYTRDEVVAMIRDGKKSPLENPAGHAPPIYMPAWKHIVNDEYINSIVDYLWSKQQKTEKSKW
jgi:mono/diheme cytochrome c family protein